MVQMRQAPHDVSHAGLSSVPTETRPTDTDRPLMWLEPLQISQWWGKVVSLLLSHFAHRPLRFHPLLTTHLETHGSTGHHPADVRGIEPRRTSRLCADPLYASDQPDSNRPFHPVSGIEPEGDQPRHPDAPEAYRGCGNPLSIVARSVPRWASPVSAYAAMRTS